MSSLNPVVGVSICIGALGAGLAYLAYNNKDEEEDTVKNNIDSTEEESETKPKPETENEPEPETENEPEPEPEPENVKMEVIKEIKNTNRQSKMQEFLKETYDKINTLSE